METLKKLFELQLKNNNPLTEESLKTLELKTYFNGEKKKVGDVVLYAMLVGDVIEREGDHPELPVEVITLNEKHFNQFDIKYRYQKNYGTDFMPFIMLKK